MAQKWYLANRRQNLSLLTLVLVLPVDLRVEQRIINGGYVREASASLHCFNSLVHSVLYSSTDETEQEPSWGFP